MRVTHWRRILTLNSCSQKGSDLFPGLGYPFAENSAKIINLIFEPFPKKEWFSLNPLPPFCSMLLILPWPQYYVPLLMFHNFPNFWDVIIIFLNKMFCEINLTNNIVYQILPCHGMVFSVWLYFLFEFLFEPNLSLNYLYVSYTDKLGFFIIN